MVKSIEFASAYIQKTKDASHDDFLLFILLFFDIFCIGFYVKCFV